jgi:hypothetical protein
MCVLGFAVPAGAGPIWEEDWSGYTDATVATTSDPNTITGWTFSGTAVNDVPEARVAGNATGTGNGEGEGDDSDIPLTPATYGNLLEMEGKSDAWLTKTGIAIPAGVANHTLYISFIYDDGGAADEDWGEGGSTDALVIDIKFGAGAWTEVVNITSTSPDGDLIWNVGGDYAWQTQSATSIGNPGGAATMDIRIGYEGISSNAHALNIDEIEITPEPATLALMGLGVAVTLLRKRR